MDGLVAGAMLVGPWACGALAGRFLGRTWGGLVLAAGLGCAVAAAGVVAFLLTAPTSSPAGCEGCGEYLGRWLDGTLVREWPLYTAVAWAGGAVAAASLAHRGRGDRLPGRAAG